MKTCPLNIVRKGDTVAQLSARLTETVSERTKGLLGSEPPGANEALWIKPCNSVHMFFMRYALDIIYLNKQGIAVKLVKELKPWRLSGCLFAQSVLEMAPGSIDALGIMVGDEIQ